MPVNKIDRALRLAVEAHARQNRKGTSIPYITHPMGVALLLARAGASDDVIAAGLLHDTVEDCSISLEQIAHEFGLWTAVIVGGCTEPDKELPWELRKQNKMHALRTAPPEVKLVVCADKLHNVRAMREDYEAAGDQLWLRFNRGRDQQSWYYRSMVDCLRPESEGDVHAGLYRELEAEVTALFGPH